MVVHTYQRFRFLLARLHIELLLDKRRIKEVKATLANLHNGEEALDKAYKEALLRIECQTVGDCKLAKKVLSWISLAKRPLTVSEILCALAVEPDETAIDPENVPSIEDLVSVCAGLVVVDQESAVIRLVHYTTQEYFEKIGNAWNPKGQLHISTTCLTYLAFDAFQDKRSSADFGRFLKKHQFLDYAAKHWGHHASTVETEIIGLACTVLKGCIMQFVGQFKYSDNPYGRPFHTTVLHYTARYGLTRITEAFLSTSDSLITTLVNALDSDGRAPLSSAAGYGHLEMVRLLLAKGADVNQGAGFHGCALQEASAQGYKEVVELLLASGADTNAKNGTHTSALKAASARGHVQVVMLLLNEGANYYGLRIQYNSALRAASSNGHKEVVKLLLNTHLFEIDAEISARGACYHGALEEASSNGHEGVVRLLLTQCASFYSKNMEYENALCAAASNGHEPVLLLAQGADVNSQGGAPLCAASKGGHVQMVTLLIKRGAKDFNRALLAACCQGRREVAEILLKEGAQANSRSETGGSALQQASNWDDEQLIKLLLDCDAKVNSQSESYPCALYKASWKGHERVVKLLLDAGADPNIQGGEHGNPLFAALVRGHEHVAELLLEKGADPNEKGAKYHNAPLYAASTRGFEQVVRLLIGEGANVNAQGGYYGSALFVASVHGHEHVVELLLESGADPNVESTKYRNAPLYAASTRGHEQVVGLLLKKGANVDARGGSYGNALFAASVQGHKKVVKLLLENNADPDAQGTKYSHILRTKLHLGHEKVAKLLLEKGFQVRYQHAPHARTVSRFERKAKNQESKMPSDKDAGPC
jgi:ankyrin repeat protein